MIMGKQCMTNSKYYLRKTSDCQRWRYWLIINRFIKTPCKYWQKNNYWQRISWDIGVCDGEEAKRETAEENHRPEIVSTDDQVVCVTYRHGFGRLEPRRRLRQFVVCSLDHGVGQLGGRRGSRLQTWLMTQPHQHCAAAASVYIRQ